MRRPTGLIPLLRRGNPALRWRASLPIVTMPRRRRKYTAARHVSCSGSAERVRSGRYAVFDIAIDTTALDTHAGSDPGLLTYLQALTFDFERDGQVASAVVVYAEPDPHLEDSYHAVLAADTGFEGIACIDDTARAALLALGIYERYGASEALDLARRWLSFVEYMQYPDGSFANFIRNAAGVRNATGPTSVRGGHWWSARAKWALARAYRVTGAPTFRERYDSCRLVPLQDGKINGILALAEMEMYRATGDVSRRQCALEHCSIIMDVANGAPYLRDQLGTDAVNFWGYHQLPALAEAALLFDRNDLLTVCRGTVRNLIEPNIKGLMWHSYPPPVQDGVTAYDVTPVVHGLAAMYQMTGAKRYRELALRASAWFYGRNSARAAMYDPTTGRCRDGITAGVASANCGAESAIEAGLAELFRRQLHSDQ